MTEEKGGLVDKNEKPIETYPNEKASEDGVTGQEAKEETKPRTKEEVLAEMRKDMCANPESYIKMSNLVAAFMLGPNGEPMTLVNPKASYNNIVLAQHYLNYNIDNHVKVAQMQTIRREAEDHKNKIVRPGGNGFFNNLRRMGKKRH